MIFDMKKNNKRAKARNKYLKNNPIRPKRNKYTDDVKLIAIKMKENGYSEEEITKITKATPGTRAKWNSEYKKSKKEGYIKEPKKKCGRKLKVNIDILDKLIKENRKLDGKKIRFLYNTKTGETVCCNTILAAIKRLGYKRCKGELRFDKFDEKLSNEAEIKINKVIKESKENINNYVPFFLTKQP